MFNFPSLDLMDKLEVAKTRKEAVEYWRMLKHLHELWSAFGERAERLIAVYDWHKKQKPMVDALGEVLNWHDIKTVNIAAEMDRVDQYLKAIAIELGEAPMDASVDAPPSGDETIPF